MDNETLHRLAKKLGNQLKEKKLKPVPLPSDCRETIKANWGSVCKAAEVIGLDCRLLYKHLKALSIPNYRAHLVFYLLTYTIEEHQATTE